METFQVLQGAGCVMKVVCGKSWSELSSTDEDGIRFCGDCKKLVFQTKTPAELRVAAKRGLCVYIVPNSASQIEPSEHDHLEVSPERIKQIYAKTLKRLKGPTMGSAKMLW